MIDPVTITIDENIAKTLMAYRVSADDGLDEPLGPGLPDVPDGEVDVGLAAGAIDAEVLYKSCSRDMTPVVAVLL
ncbi:15886_t:CDS:2, partial [Cetraspora pellucida]